MGAAGFDISGALLADGDFSKVNFKESQLSKVWAPGANFDGADFTNGVIDRAYFTRCSPARPSRRPTSRTATSQTPTWATSTSANCARTRRSRERTPSLAHPRALARAAQQQKNSS